MNVIDYPETRWVRVHKPVIRRLFLESPCTLHCMWARGKHCNCKLCGGARHGAARNQT